MGERPGEASAQYNHGFGEAGADISDSLRPSLGNVAKELLAYDGGGQVVGIRIYSFGRIDGAHVAIQVVEDVQGVDNINKALAETKGELVVKEYYRTDVSVTDFVKCFKRLHVSLFNPNIKAREVRVSDRICLEDEES